MENENKNIDNLFKTAAQDYRYQPSSEAWETINTKLHKKKGFTIFALMPLLKIAAIVVLVTFSAVLLYKNDRPQFQVQNLPKIESNGGNFSMVKSQNIYNIYAKLAEKSQLYN